MKPRRREVNIFNMSVLDLLTGALGAFCFLTLALFPSYYRSRNSSNSAAANYPPAQSSSSGKPGIPPFSITEVWTSNTEGYRCGTIKLKDLHAPRGRQSYSQVAMRGDVAGYDNIIYLFLYDTGSYRATITGYGSSPSCFFRYLLHTSKENMPGYALMTETPVDYLFNLEVKPDQLITSIAPRR
jgi:hypothetical protein